MKITFPLLAILFLSACASSQVTVTSEVTVTSPPLPTETPFPTTTPTPVAVDGVATIDGVPHIFDETSQNWVALPDVPGEFAKIMVTDDKLVVALDKDGVELYSLDMETGEWVEAVTFEPMELSVKKIGTCDYEADIASGRLAWSVEQAVKNGDIEFPTDAHNAGWENEKGYSSLAPIYLNPDSKEAMQVVNICKINDAFLDLPNYSSYVATVAVKNTDGTMGVLNFFLFDKKTLDWFWTVNLANLGITKEFAPETVKTYWDDARLAPAARLYVSQDEKKIMTELNRLQIDGVVSDELEKILISPSKR
ncbi:MAG: hypothetical protein RIR73_2705 [Chloroflexota bacterium]